jgi:uncharacterized protein YbbC (DUF1343 family)
MTGRSRLNAACGLLMLAASLSAAAADAPPARVHPGIEVFLSRYTGLVKGKRVGLVTNPTGVDGQRRPTVDLLRRHPDVNLVALFAPEHGIRGDIEAGAPVPGGRDPVSGLPVFTLYGGKDHKPPAAGLAKIDVMIYDIQDVGSRAYTYIWHMAECMSGCAAAGKAFIVLDRPNIFGANTIDGPVTERQHLSFIGLYPVPRVYGMTAGELARYLNVEERIGARLTVIPMLNYRRGMIWRQTGLPWVPTSPNVPTPEAAAGFAATGTIGELSSFNIGLGSRWPFQIVAAPWLDATRSAAQLNALGLPGVRFQAFRHRPTRGMFTGQDVNALFIQVTQPALFRPTTTEVNVLCHLQRTYPGKIAWDPAKTPIFDKAMGTTSVRRGIIANTDPKQIVASWTPDLRTFLEKRQKYLIYK